MKHFLVTKPKGQRFISQEQGRNIELAQLLNLKRLLLQQLVSSFLFLVSCYLYNTFLFCLFWGFGDLDFHMLRDELLVSPVSTQTKGKIRNDSNMKQRKKEKKQKANLMYATNICKGDFFLKFYTGPGKLQIFYILIW